MSFERLPDVEIRKHICLNGLWSFQCETDDKPTLIRVPSSYSIQREGKWSRYYWDAFDYPARWEKKGATYSRKFTVPPEMHGMNIRFYCGGCSYHSKVLVNGKVVGESHDGYYPFEFSVDDALVEGENTLEVVVEARSGDTYGGESESNRGIWKDTWLKAYPELSVESGAYVETSVKNSSLTCVLPIRNNSGQHRAFTIKNLVTDADGNVVKVFDGGSHSLAPGSEETYSSELHWEDAHLWFPHDPYLYHLNTVLVGENGKAIDWNRIRFGFREISIDGPHLYLNGRELFLRGHGGHYCGDLQGTREYAAQWITSLKELGVNFMRLHVYPRHKELYEVADELGFLLEAEAAYHFRVPDDPKLWKDHLSRMVADQRNHPSVILWSVSNELRWRGGGEKKELIDFVRSLDPSRPVFASDFSGWSIHGDVIGHHYNAKTVFEEWERFGPNKPMIWDELGNVWQPDRPLRNGTAGYEVTCQDYATGLWRDGHDDMLADIQGMADGKFFCGEHHRVNGFIPWDLSYCFFRFQPTNNHRTLELQWPSLEGPGIKQKIVKSCSSTVNIWDEDLPVFEPNPGFYFFEKYLRAVRFFDKEQTVTFFAGDKTTRTSKLFYEDLRFADEISCRVESVDGRVLWERSVPVDIKPGQVIEQIRLDFEIPSVTSVTRANIVREFRFEGTPGYKDKVQIKIFPRFVGTMLPELNGKTIGVKDQSGQLQRIFADSGVAFVNVDDGLGDGLSSLDLLVIADEGCEWTDEVDGLVQGGGRVLLLCNGSIDVTGGHLPSARLLLNGAKHRLLDGLGQEDFTYWRGGAVSGAMERPSGPMNFRVVLSGDKDGISSALHEVIRGRGLGVATSLRIAASFDEEPVAGWMLKNILCYLAGYEISQEPKRTAVLSGSKLRALLGDAGLVGDELDPALGIDLSRFTTLAIDASDKGIAAKMGRADCALEIAKFVENGGRVLLYNVTKETLPVYRGLVGRDLALTEPFLLENRHCVKAATSWTRRDTPRDLVEYYDGILIPQPFEPNYDPLIAGMSNIDLYFDGEPMFESGIEISGMDPVSASDDHNILISNWRIDWSQPKYGGEYIQEAKDIRRADWFVNRDPVLLRVNSGAGSWFICQLSLENGGGKGIRLARQILTGMGCSIGVETGFAAEDYTFDMSARREQLARFAKPSAKAPARRLKYGLGLADGGQSQGDGLTVPKVLIIGDAVADRYVKIVKRELSGWAEVKGANEDGLLRNLSSREVLKNIYSLIEGSRWQIIHFSCGLEDLKRYGRSGDGEARVLNSEGEQVVSLDEFERNLVEIVKVLKTTGAKLFWGSITPLPLGAKGYRANDEVAYNQVASKIMEKNGVYINDLHDFVQKTIPEYAKGDRVEFTEEECEVLGRQVASAIRYFGE